MIELTVGLRVRSQVCATEAIVVRAATSTAPLTCGGHPVIAKDAEPDPSLRLEASSAGSLLGKRYADPSAGIELLITRAGDGALAIGGEPLALVDSKRLPSSD